MEQPAFFLSTLTVVLVHLLLSNHVLAIQIGILYSLNAQQLTEVSSSHHGSFKLAFNIIVFGAP